MHFRTRKLHRTAGARGAMEICPRDTFALRITPDSKRRGRNSPAFSKSGIEPRMARIEEAIAFPIPYPRYPGNPWLNLFGVPKGIVLANAQKTANL